MGTWQIGNNVGIAFVIFPDELYGGIARYMSMLAVGLRKLDFKFKFIIVDKGRTNKTLRNYYQYGMKEEECILVKNEYDAIKLINTYDFIIYPAIKNAADTPFFKHHDEGVCPWWYTVVQCIEKPSVAIVHSTYDFTKYGPYVHIYESNTNAFIAVNSIIAKQYHDARGFVDCYTLPIPIDCSKKYDLSKPRTNLIALTSRLDSVKRIHHMVSAMHKLPNWKLELHSGVSARDYFTVQRLLELQAGLESVEFIDYDHAFTLAELDGIYENAALTYNATYFPNGHGGLECATMEAALRGVVPILTPEWIEPWDDCPPLDACYKFDIMSKHLNGTDNTIAEVVAEIDITSKDYSNRQHALVEYIQRFDSLVLAKEFLGILKDVK